MRRAGRLRAAALFLAMTDCPVSATEAGLNVPADIAQALIACWHPPHEGDEISVRMSFRRDGSIFGKPRMTYMKAGGGLDRQAALATSIYQAIAACQPLRFTSALGAAIAGRTVLIRFVAPRRKLRASILPDASAGSCGSSVLAQA